MAECLDARGVTTQRRAHFERRRALAEAGVRTPTHRGPKLNVDRGHNAKMDLTRVQARAGAAGAGNQYVACQPSPVKSDDCPSRNHILVYGGRPAAAVALGFAATIPIWTLGSKSVQIERPHLALTWGEWGSNPRPDGL